SSDLQGQAGPGAAGAEPGALRSADLRYRRGRGRRGAAARAGRGGGLGEREGAAPRRAPPRRRARGPRLRVPRQARLLRPPPEAGGLRLAVPDPVTRTGHSLPTAAGDVPAIAGYALRIPAYPPPAHALLLPCLAPTEEQGEPSYELAHELEGIPHDSGNYSEPRRPDPRRSG